MSAETRAQSVVDAERQIATNPHESVVRMYSERLPYDVARKQAFEQGRSVKVLIEVEVALTDPQWTLGTLLENIPDYFISAIDDAERTHFDHFPDSAYMVDAADLCVWIPTATVLTAVHAMVDDYVWPDPNSDGWIDAWNGWYPTEEEARRDGAAGVGTPWVLQWGEGLITQDEAEARQA